MIIFLLSRLLIELLASELSYLVPMLIIIFLLSPLVIKLLASKLSCRVLKFVRWNTTFTDTDILFNLN